MDAVPKPTYPKHPELFERDGVPSTKWRAIVVDPVVNPNTEERGRRLIDALARLYFEPEIQSLLDELVKNRPSDHR